MSENKDRISESLRALSEEHRDLYGASIEVLKNAYPNPLHFHRSFVSQNKPCLIQGAASKWKAHELWSSSYFREKLGERMIPVVATPDGRADAIHRLPNSGEEVFALPAEGSLPMAALLDHLELSDGVKAGANKLYMQQQNDCLRKDFPELLEDIQPMLPWADEAFGSQAEAVNLWIGGRESVTTFHKDPYENLFVVISGYKTFHLLPPSDYYRLKCKDFPVAQFNAENQDLGTCHLCLVKKEGSGPVKWSAIDPRSEITSPSKQLDTALPRPLTVTVKSGEVLYLPSLWHHFVEQEGGPDGVCIAVNFWYDMAFDSKFAYYSLAEKLGDICNR